MSCSKSRVIYTAIAFGGRVTWSTSTITIAMLFMEVMPVNAYFHPYGSVNVCGVH